MKNFISLHFNPFVLNAPFHYPLKTSENRKVEKGCIGNEWVNYYLLVWMFHDQGLNTKIDGIYERSGRSVYGDNKYSFEELRQKGKSMKIHHKNLQVLATEIYKVTHGVSPHLINNEQWVPINCP